MENMIRQDTNNDNNIVYAKRGNVMDIYTLVKSITIGDSVIRLFSLGSFDSMKIDSSVSATDVFRGVS